MDVPLSSAIAAFSLALALMAFVALAEVSLATISRERVRRLGEEGVSAALLVEHVLKDVERFLAGILVLRTLAIGMAMAAATWLALHRRGDAFFLAQVLAGAGILLLLLQVTGRMLAVQHPLGVALRVVRPLRWLLIVAAPLTWPLLRLARRAGAGDANSPRSIFLTEDGLRLLLNFGEEERFIEEDEREMIDSIFRFSETTVGEVMAPRVDVVALDHGASLQMALDAIVEGGHSRIPIYEDTIDHVIGVLYAKDLLACYREGTQNAVITDLMRKPYFVPESAMVDDLLGDLQHKKVHLAIVVDEYGGTAGVVTIEDLLEEIVGEIQDEYDTESPLIQRLTPGVYMVSGRVDVDDLNRELGLQLTDEDESYTLAGVIFSHLQRVPEVGDTLELDGARIEIVAVKDNRIEQVRLSLAALQAQSAETDQNEKETA